MVEKIADLRMFDEAGDGETKTTMSIKDIGGSALVISQFILLADARLSPLTQRRYKLMSCTSILCKN